MEKIRYFIREGFKNIWVNRMMTVASVCVLTVCLVLLGSSLLVSVNVRSLISQMEDTNQIMVYIKDNVDQKGIDALGQTLSGISNVEKVVFVSKEEALESQKKALGSDAVLLQGYENDNFYPNAYRVQVRDMNRYSATAGAISKLDGVETVKANSDVAGKLNNISRVIGIVGFWLFVLLAAVSLFLISNTIKVAVYVRRREVNIMKFVGATDGFIRWPFVIEGILLGLVSGALACVTQWYVYRGLISRLFGVLNVHIMAFGGNYWYLGMGFAAAGILVGVLGSLISVRRYLRV